MAKTGPKPKRRMKASAAALRCPSYLPDHGKALWRKIVPELQRQGISVLDAPSLEALCIAYAMMRQSAEILARDGAIIEGARGNPVRNPAMLTFIAAQTAVKSWAAEFGLSLSARSMLPDDATVEVSIDDVAAHLFGGQ